MKTDLDSLKAYISSACDGDVLGFVKPDPIILLFKII